MKTETIKVEGPVDDLYCEWLSKHPAATEEEADAFIAGMAYMKDCFENGAFSKQRKDG